MEKYMEVRDPFSRKSPEKEEKIKMRKHLHKLG